MNIIVNLPLIFFKGSNSKYHNHLPHHKHNSPIESPLHHSNNPEHNGASGSFKQQQTNSLDSIDQLVNLIELSGGPLAYTYSLSHIALHYGRDEMRGSEHTIAGIQFPGELQFNFFNQQLYSSYDEAQNKAHGLATIAIMIQMAEVSGKAPNSELKKLIDVVQNITIKGKLRFMFKEQMKLNTFKN